eukprot:326147_1
MDGSPSYDDHSKSVNHAIDHHLCRLSGIYHKSEKEFVDSAYLPLEGSDSESEIPMEEEEDDDEDDGSHSSDDEEDQDGYQCVVDAQLGQGL